MLIKTKYKIEAATALITASIFSLIDPAGIFGFFILTLIMFGFLQYFDIAFEKLSTFLDKDNSDPILD